MPLHVRPKPEFGVDACFGDMNMHGLARIPFVGIEMKPKALVAKHDGHVSLLKLGRAPSPGISGERPLPQTSENFTQRPSSALDLTAAVMKVMPSTPSSSVGNRPT